MKVTVVGAGNVGATCANCIAEKDIVNEVVLGYQGRCFRREIAGYVADCPDQFV